MVSVRREGHLTLNACSTGFSSFSQCQIRPGGGCIAKGDRGSKSENHRRMVVNGGGRFAMEVINHYHVLDVTIRASRNSHHVGISLSHPPAQNASRDPLLKT